METCTGNAATATQFSANKSVTLTGDVTGTASSKAGWSVATTLANSGVTAGTYGPSADVTGDNNATISVPEITVDAKGRVTSVVNRTLTCKNNTYSVYNKTLTIQKNGTNVATFTSNSNTNVTANITVPTKVSELTNDSGYLTSHQSLSNYVTLNSAQTISGNKTFTGTLTGTLTGNCSGTSGGLLTNTTFANRSFTYTEGSVAIGTTAGKSFKGSSNNAALVSFPENGTSSNNTSANIQNLRFTWQSDGKYLHDLFTSPNSRYFWHRDVNNASARPWRRIVEENTTDVTPPTWDISIGGNSATATKATGNANGKELTNTIIKGLSISGKTITYTQIDGTTGTLTTQDNNTWTAMVGATSSANGSVGYVNAVPPKDGYNTKYLRADGTWAVPPDHTYTVNNATLTIQKNGTNVATFTSNASSNVTANITVPTKTSELTNNSGFLTSHQDLSLYPYKLSSASNGGTWTYINLADDSHISTGFNDVVETGNYHARTTADVPGTPVASTTDGILIVLNTGSAANISSNRRCQQFYWTNGVTPRLFKRLGSYSGGWTWKTWVEIATTASDITGNAATATSNANGKELTNTIIKGLSISGKTITFTQIDGNTGTLTTQDTNTDTKVTQTVTTANSNYPIIIGNTVDQTATETSGARFTAGAYINARYATLRLSNVYDSDALKGTRPTSTRQNLSIQGYTKDNAIVSQLRGEMNKSGYNRTFIQTTNYIKNGAVATDGTATTCYIAVDVTDNGTKQIQTDGLWVNNLTPSTTNSRTLGTSSLLWKALYATTVYEGGTALSSKYTVNENFGKGTTIPLFIKADDFPNAPGTSSASIDYNSAVDGTKLYVWDATCNSSSIIGFHPTLTKVTTKTGQLWRYLGTTVHAAGLGPAAADPIGILGLFRRES